MLSEQAILTEQLTTGTESMPLGFIISDDGRTLLAVTERDDGILEFMSVPVTIQQSNVITAAPMKTNEGSSIFQVTLEAMGADNAAQQAALFTTQGYQTIPVLTEPEQPSFAPKAIELNAGGTTVELTPSATEINSLQTKNFEIFETPVSSALPLPPPVVKRSPGRPRKDGSTPPSAHPNNLKCKICGKGFTRLMLLRRHTEQHAEEKPHRCPKCPASFNVPTNFTLHMATHNIGEPKCPECGRKFARMASLKSHMLLHEKEENLFCTECEDAFTTKAQLDAHLKLHNEKWTTDDVRKCKLCNKQFTQPALYRLHIREHYRLQTKLVKQTKKGVKQKTMYKCKICLKSFQKPSQLVRHIRVHTGEKPFQCTICTRAFTQKGSLQIHMWKHNGFRPHNCSFCNAKFSQKGNLNAHILRVHNVPDGKPYYKCTYCPCTFKKLGSLNAHMKKMHSNPKPQSCVSSTEDMQATVDTVMSQLAMLESGVKNPADSTANSSPNKDILQQALKNSGLPSKDKEPAPEVQTPKKGEAQTTMVTLLDSSIDSATRKYVTIKQRTIGNTRWYTCSYCHKEFKKPSDLIRHLRVHTQEKPFKCSYCSRSFAVKSTMIAHERTHTGVKKYMCCNCNKMFACHSSLTTHMRIHAGVKPFTCNICDKSFSANTLLKSHMKSHAKTKTKPTPQTEIIAPSIVLEEPLIITDAGNKISIAQVQSKHQQVYNSNDVARPHKCWVCPAAFRKMSHLKQHYRRHTGERPYKCQKCNRKFTSNSVLKSHLQTHEGSRPYNCSMCSAKFSTQSSMKRHLATHSNKRPFMCPYCHKTFKTSVNCRKHMKIHKHELAQQQLNQQQSGQQQPNQLQDKPAMTVLSENLTLPEEMEVTFQPQMAPDFSQAFSDQFHTIAVEKDKPLIPQNNPIQTIVNQAQPAVEPINLGPTQTLHADETGTITLPNYSGDQTLTPESIREIEETLNQQLFNIGMNLGLGGNLTRQISETSPNSLEQREQPILNIIYENSKNVETSTSGTINSGIFAPQFDSFDMSHIALQGENEMDIGITPANSTSMASILPRSAQEEQHLVSVTTTTSMPDDSQSKQPRHLMVVSSMQSCPELSRPVQACPKYPKVIAKADTTDGLDVPTSEETVKDIAVQAESLLPEKPSQIPSYKCKVCDKTFNKQSQLRTHKKIHTLEMAQKPEDKELASVAESENLLQCHMCSKTGLTAVALKDHLKTHKGVKEFQCTECPLKFCTNGGLSRHLKIHTNKILWKCATCDLTFQNKTQLLLHEEFHQNSTSLNTVEPDSSQKDPLTIDGNYLAPPHIRLEDNSIISEKVLMDAVAEKETETDLKKDKKVYTNKCKYCPKTFRKPSDLVRHIRTHTGERPYQCEYCNKCFAVKCTLDCHMKVHTGKKTFSCHVCNSLFTTKGSLKVHMRLHTGSKPFKCPTCDLRFRTSGHRKVHLLTHMREHKDPSKPKPKVRKIAAIAGVAAELERSVGNNVNAEATGPHAEEYGNIDSITIETNALTENITPHITFNADGTILNNNAMLSLNESNELVANLHFLLAHGLVTIQSDDPMLQQMPDAETNVIQNGTTVEELIDPESLRAPTQSLISNTEMSDSNSQPVLYETENMENGGTESHGTLELDDCMQIDPGKMASLSDPEESNQKLTIDRTQFRRECDICGKSFLKPCQVERHKRIHTGERPYKCNLCSKSFTQKSTLKIHQKHHTGDRPYPCPHCDFSFSQKGNLKTHLKRVHQLDTLVVKKLRRGQHLLSAKIEQDNLEDDRIIGLEDISFANIH
ncbi:zinc finger protein 236 isoform X1 [Neodiprion pinetum]|uniref:zinc finger protein 236 isoform X1 n=1 Tax=Neodiprion pinetum TaxID=441929 RepID=UPI001EDF9BB5|nr:zinc finger protein 236-like isoform X1 [Neodiprion pinetum]XP_046466967.1 zinc finger protein 236-like isoform X1 [Neodiprion pinetum]